MIHMIYCLVPATHIDEVKQAMFAAGAGKIGNYSHCAWQTLGEGQFKPLAGSNAFIGEIDDITKVPEYKVEMICLHEDLQAIVAALKHAHPYETPAYYVVKCEEI